MKKLILPEIESDSLYEQIIINSRDQNKKDKLSEIKDVIFERYAHYETNINNLELITVSPILDVEEQKYLKSNYSRNKSGYLEGEVISKILKIQTPQLKNKCPYCGIDKPRTIDHYLPQSLFPEYSIFPRNLIPCCGNCNSKKGKRWISSNGKRIFINYYYDNLPYDKVFLNVDIDYKEECEAPNVIFRLSNTNLEQEEYDLINSHFENLELVEEYEAIVEEELSNIRDTALESVELDSAQLVKNVKISLRTFERKYGVNYWKSALYRAINEDFFDHIRSYKNETITY